MKLSRRGLIFSGAGVLSRIAKASGSCSQCRPCDETIACFDPLPITDSKGGRHTVYVAGQGPPVVVLHELPGLTPQDIRLANKLVCEGYAVLLPLLFGQPGDNRFSHYLHTICGKDQFNCAGSGQTPRPVDWVREYCASIRKTWREGLGIGVIGMCLTGEFPIPLMALPDVKAAVMCQPTDPFNILTLIHLGPGSKLSLAGSDIEAAQKSGLPILGIKYAGDPYCPDARFKALAKLFPGRFYWLELAGHRHSSLGEHLCDAAFDEVSRYLGQQLKGVSPIPGKKFPNLAQLTDGPPKSKISCGMPANNCKS